MDDQARFAQRRDRFRSYEDPAAVTAYLERLEREWPERAIIADYITAQLAQLADPEPQVLELCCGPGRLAGAILDTLPTVHYTGVDISPPFLAFAREKLAEHAARTTLLALDLSRDEWPLPLSQPEHNRFHAIVSLQSLHDVGDAGVIERIYRQANALLQPGGFFLNADLIVPEGAPLPDNPGRLPIPRHLELLAAAGYADVRCPLTPGGFGVVVGSEQLSVASRQ